MNLEFEELDHRRTPLGEINLRRRRDPRLDNKTIYEVKLGEEFLMSSLVTAGEVALAERALAAVFGEALDIVVGGLGLGYTARAALSPANVRSVLVIEALGPVIDWHARGLVPLGPELNSDTRCRLICGDFFALATSTEGFDHAEPARRYDAILLDIDHSPRHRLTDGQDDFYGRRSLTRMRAHLRAGGVFAMWSNEPPEDTFRTELGAVFDRVRADIIEFPNPYTGAKNTCTIYLAWAET